jgi:hypothetical protein
VRILEASSHSLRQGGAPVELSSLQHNGHVHTAAAITRGTDVKTKKIFPAGMAIAKKHSPQSTRKAQIKVVLNGNGRDLRA